MGKLINIGGRYANAEAVDKVIRYVTRTRTNETRAENLQDMEVSVFLDMIR